MIHEEALHSLECDNLETVVRAILAVSENLNDVPRENLSVLPLLVATENGDLKALLDDLLLCLGVHVINDERPDLNGGLGRRFGLKFAFELRHVHLCVMFWISLIGRIPILTRLVGGLINGDLPFSPIETAFARLLLRLRLFLLIPLRICAVICLRHCCHPRSRTSPM